MDEFQVIKTKSSVFYPLYERKAELQRQTHYCPGCGHGVVHKLIAEAVADMDMQDQTIFVSPVGCSVFAYFYFDVGNVQAAHGRTPAVATAVKRSNPNSLVIAYQGDGDLAAIGTAEIVHAANRGEKLSVFFVNNGIYGMTGGQMAPTTLVGQISTTSPFGRRPSNEGYPLQMAELLATLKAPVYIERVSLSDNKNIMKARKAVRHALQLQREGAGFSFVEILSPCPTIWKMPPDQAKAWIAQTMETVFPLSVLRDRKPLPETAMEPIPQTSVLWLLGLDKPAKKTSARATPKKLHRDLSVKIAGFGGQGVLLLGEILAEMGMREGREVSWLPSYGPEMRSGSAHCHVCIANERVGSPVIEHPDVLIAMNEISLHKFAPHNLPGSSILFNAEELPAKLRSHPASIFCIPASRIADDLGNAKVTNMVMLGALLELTGILPRETSFDLLREKLGQIDLLELDIRAIDAGIAHMRNLLDDSEDGKNNGGKELATTHHSRPR
jgi:2-oxoisovalerate ferredoxin oxidoreductase beta subunit